MIDEASDFQFQRIGFAHILEPVNKITESNFIYGKDQERQVVVVSCIAWSDLLLVIQILAHVWRHSGIPRLQNQRWDLGKRVCGLEKYTVVYP